MNDLAYAYGGPLGQAALKQRFEDFQVTEVLGFELDGSGEHFWLFVEKTDLNTADVTQRLQTFCSVSNAAIGHSGLKDRKAVTRQWFSAHLPGQPEPDWSQLDGDGMRVIEQGRHSRKLRVGVHQANEFSIVLRDVNIEPSLLADRMHTIIANGAPNYFGEQRFGRNGRNLQSAQRLFQRTAGKAFKPRRKDGMLLSATRSHIFNQVLNSRVQDQSWAAALSGDVFQFEDGSTLFSSTELSSEQQRINELAINVTGPLYGEGGKKTSHIAEQIEQDIFAANEAYCKGLLAAGMKGARRSLRMIPQDLRWSYVDDTLSLSFRLKRGSFATSLIREIVQANTD